MTIRWRQLRTIDSYIQWDGGTVIWDANGNVTDVFWDISDPVTIWTEIAV